MQTFWKQLFDTGRWHRAPAALGLCLALTGCATSSSGGRGPVTLIDRSAHPAFSGTRHAGYAEVFRAFRETGFPAGKWVVEGAELRSVSQAAVDLITRDEFRDFELALEWRVTKGANSGLMYGVTEEADQTFWSGPEYQINDDPNHKDGRDPLTSAGGLYALLPPHGSKQLQPTGDWNRTRIVSRGGHIEHWLNGSKILEYDWNSPALRARIEKTKFAGKPHFMKELRGHLALQHHNDEVWFRRITIIRY